MGHGLNEDAPTDKLRWARGVDSQSSGEDRKPWQCLFGLMNDAEKSAPRRPFRCRFGLHDWSDTRGGVRVCERDGCHRATTYGLTGAMRRLAWERELYEDYRRHTATDADSDR